MMNEAHNIRLSILSPDRPPVVKQTGKVTLPGKLGSMTILPGHAPLMTSLNGGDIVFSVDGAEESIAIAGGFAEVLGDQVTILATRK